MERVTGIGGIFFRCKDPAATRAWYEKHLGLNVDDYGTSFEWGGRGFTAWSPFKDDTDYFGPSGQQFMVNYRVADMDALLAVLREEGVEVVADPQVLEFGKFAHIVDPDGHRIELWEPNDEAYRAMVEGNTTS